MVDRTFAGYKHTVPFDSGYIAVEPPHELYYERYGSRTGKPVIFLHGGPGGNVSKDSATFFDPEVYHVVLFDQRGAGKSKPLAEVRANTTWDLIEDIELLKRRFSVEKWHIVFGGSWGSTLAIAYAQAFPTSVGSLVLRGVLTATKRELDLIHASATCRSFYPDAYEAWLDFLPINDRDQPGLAYYRMLTSDDGTLRKAAARAWNTRELTMGQLHASTDALLKLEDENWSLAHATLELHYFLNNLFMEPGQLLTDLNISKIKNVPTSIVQGRNDILCPPSAAWALHKALPNSKLYLIPAAGHSTNEPPIRSKLIEICNEHGNMLLNQDIWTRSGI